MVLKKKKSFLLLNLQYLTLKFSQQFILSLCTGGEKGKKKKREMYKVLKPDFPGGPVVKILCFQHRGHRFNPWLGN